MNPIVRPTITATLLERVAQTPDQIAFRIPDDGIWKSRTFRQFFDEVELAAFGLLAIGMLPEDRLALLSNTRYEWTWLDFATLGARGISVPIYPSSTAEDVRTIIEHAQTRFVVLENRLQLAKFLAARSAHPESLAFIDRVIVIEPAAMAIAGPAQIGDFASKILSLPALLELGRRLQAQDPGRIRKNMMDIRPEDPFTIAYTSGASGVPKGAVLTHDNVASVFEDAVRTFGRDIEPNRESTVSFLPYSHIIGRMESLMIHVFGWKCSFAESLDQLMDHLVAVQPTILFAVPRVFEKAHQKVLHWLDTPGRGKVSRQILRWTLNSLGNSSQHPLLSMGAQLTRRTLLRSVRARFGGKLKFAICGGAPLSPQVAEFFEQIGILALEGYGLTETSAPVALNTPREHRFGTVGKPLPEAQIKIASDGEILVRSRKVFREYWRMPEETRAAFEGTAGNGWFKTGDLGQFDGAGYLQITGRKKDLLITSGGKNIAPQKIESLAKAYPLFSHLVVVGDRRHFLSALICPDLVWLEKYAAEHSILYSGIPELLQNPKVITLVERTLQDLNQNLASFETIKRFVLLPKDFSVESGELTPSLKIRRSVITQRYQTEIDQIYTSP